MRTSTSRRDHRTGLVFVALLVLGLTTALGAADSLGVAWVDGLIFAAVSPVVETLWDVGSGVSDFAHGVVAGPALSSEVRELRRQLAYHERKRRELKELKSENSRLRKLLELKPTLSMTTVGARVVAGLSAGVPSLTLNVGKSDGVELDSAVLSPAGLVGRVVKVASGSSLVQPIAHASSGVGVVVQRTRFQAVMVGNGRGMCTLKYVPKLEDIRVGDVVLSSGADGIYPAGVPVGSIVSVNIDTGFFARVEVELAVEPRRVTEALVVRASKT